jgi:hypothetical protein
MRGFIYIFAPINHHMNKSYTKIYSRTLLLAVAMLMSFTMVATPKQKTDSTYLRLTRLNKKDKNVLKTYHANFPAIKPITVPAKVATTTQTSYSDDKLLTNVQVYPNPVIDQINLKYSISRASNVNIKIMDVLGNEVINLFSQHVEPGEWKSTYTLKNKLNSGFYFVRVVVGTESVIKRISIL